MFFRTAVCLILFDKKENYDKKCLYIFTVSCSNSTFFKLWLFIAIVNCYGSGL